MDFDSSLQAGVGVTAEARLVPLAPLIEYYEREMGELPGRLMIATSFLGDVQQMGGWETQSPEIRQAVEQAQALVVSVMVRLLNAQNDSHRHSSNKQADGLQQFLDEMLENPQERDYE